MLLRNYFTIVGLVPGESGGVGGAIEWLRKLRDPKAKVAVIRRLHRIELGNFGDHKPCRDGVWELRIDQGPGYRVYYAKSGTAIILLLSSGNKRTQDADIDRAVDYWRDWQARNRTQGT